MVTGFINIDWKIMTDTYIIDKWLVCRFFCKVVLEIISLRPDEAYMYASLRWVIIDSGNGLSHFQRQALIWTSADSM